MKDKKDRHQQFLDEIKESCSEIKNIFEVGAHRGYDVLELMEFWPEATIYAFEADPFNYEICKKRFEDNSNVHVIHAAVTDVTGPVTFNRFYDLESIPDDQTFVGDGLQNTGQGSLLKSGVGMTEIFKVKDVVEEIEVDGICLKDFCEVENIESIDALFMDVQGVEMQVLQGCGDMLPTVKSAALEWSSKYVMYEGETDFVFIKHFLEQSGFFEAVRQYQLKGISGDSLFLRNK
jgi:FkbM family methyltransferase